MIDDAMRMSALREPIAIIAHGTVKQRNAVLASATDDLVKALRTVLEVAIAHGFQVPPGHAARAKVLLTPNTALRNKVKAVAGTDGAPSRGGPFFAAAAQHMIQHAGHMLRGGGFGDLLGQAVQAATQLAPVVLPALL